jgi:CubicO group peptidase (beta-lactamase class C family)
MVAITLAALTSLAGAVPTSARADQPFDWLTATPESQGMSSRKLAALRDFLAGRKTQTFLVIRNDKIVYEWYAPGHAAGKKHGAASLSKPTVGGLALALLLADGRLKLDDLAVTYVPQWLDDRRKRKITLRHLGSHTSGLEDAEVYNVPHEKLTGWKGDFWKRLPPPNDPFTIARDRVPVAFEPGTELHYSNPGIAMLSYVVTAALKGSPHKDIRTLLRDRVMRPIGVPDEEWTVGYGNTVTVDDLPLVASWGGASYTARALARIGRLMLREGDWDGKRILSRDAVRQTTGSVGLPGALGIGWWTNAGGRYRKVPRDAYWGAGAGDQVLLVIPSLHLIMVRNGATLEPPPRDAADVFEKYHDPRVKVLFEPLLDAVTELPTGKPRSPATAPYARSPIISSLEWAPKETIVRHARESDNWPLTWADDDQLYTAYGDGWGFEPKLPTKLGLGFARIEGTATGFTGVNIRSPSGEQNAGVKKGKKASGMLMVDRVLYMWVRNAANSQLAWSEDYARTWTWCDWKFTTSFGCPTFLNFGKNYAGARDAYVYVYSHDHASAYQAADRMVLARVPRNRIRERAAYEFFKDVDAANQPSWTRDVSERGAVFRHPGRCLRSAISYNAGLKRYLWWQQIPHAQPYASHGVEDTRFKGGIGIYDAPTPWGPWSTVYFKERWDVGPGETASFPTKWMSTDGKTVFLVFSGDDSFSVRKATLSTTGSASGY